MFQLLLQERIATVIEAIRQNSDKYNNLVVSNTSSSATPQQSPLLHIEGYKNTLLDMANRLYDKLVKHFTISIITNVALNTTSLLSSPQSSSTFSNLSTQSYSYRIKNQKVFITAKEIQMIDLIKAVIYRTIKYLSATNLISEII